MDARLRRLQQQFLASPGDVGARSAFRRALYRLADLEDRERWGAADPQAQDLVIGVIGDLLGSAFVPGEIARYTAGGVTHRVGSFTHRASGMRLQLVPGGSFRMGSEEDTEIEQPVHLVRVAPLLIGWAPVLQTEWDAVGGQDERTWRGPVLPIEGVSWEEVREWLERAGSGLRLPSEAEWEYACRAGTTTRYFWGDHMDDSYCWFGDETGWQTLPPAAHAERANAFGLVDTSGNVFEWCEDAYVQGYQGAPTDGSARLRRWSWTRVVRGGDSFNGASSCRSARRSMVRKTDRGAGIGFRVARSSPL